MTSPKLLSAHPQRPSKNGVFVATHASEAWPDKWPHTGNSYNNTYNNMQASAMSIFTNRRTKGNYTHVVPDFLFGDVY